MSKRTTIERNISQDVTTKKYYIMLYYKDELGNKVRKTETANTLKEARDIRDKHEAAVKLNLVKFSPDSTNMTLSQCLNNYIEIANLEYTTACHLCGTEFKRNDTIDVFETYRREPTEDEYKLVGDEIELDEMIFDNLRLNLPVRFLCKEDCKGVCTKCGKNLNFEKCECVEEIKSSPFDVLKDRM